MGRENNQIPTIYKEAIEKYEEITKKPLLDPTLLEITSTEALFDRIEKENGKFDDFRATRHGLFDALECALKPIELVGHLVSGAASIAFPPSSLVFGSVLYLMDAAKGVSASYNAIKDLMDSLENFTVRLRIYNREIISNELSKHLSDILVVLIEVFALSRKAIKGGRFLKFARNVLIGNDDKIQAAVGRLAKLTETEHRLVGAETLTETKKTSRAVDDVAINLAATSMTVDKTSVSVSQISVNVTDINQKLNSLIHEAASSNDMSKAEQDRRDQDFIKGALKPSVTAYDWYDKISKSRVKDTGDWIRNEPFFISLVERRIPILRVSGNPGAGKSYLASNMISYLNGLYPQLVHHSSRVSVGYFFFKDDNPTTRSIHQALCDIAYQISQNDPVYAKYIVTSAITAEDISTIESAWRTLFVNFFIKKLDGTSSVYLLLDGVDEAFEAEIQPFFELVKDINEVSDHPRIQLVIVGRPQLGDLISDALEVEDVPTIYITESKNSTDIIRYIENNIRKSNILRRVSGKLRAEIVKKLSDRAQGMFIWVHLMLKELLKKRSESAIREALDCAPRGLDEMLSHVLTSFSLTLLDDYPEALNELLAWVTCAQWPLTLRELDTIMKLKSPDGDGMIYLEGPLRRQFASFFSLNREDGLTTAELHLMNPNLVDSDGEEDIDGSEEEQSFEDTDDTTQFDSNLDTTTVTFCHSSLGDFFRGGKGKISAGDGYPSIGVDIKAAEFNVTKTCLEILCGDEAMINSEDKAASLRYNEDGNWSKNVRMLGASTKSSLDISCDEESMMKADDTAASLRYYAARNWPKHLHMLDASTITIPQKAQIASLLCRMFTQQSTMKFWIFTVGPPFLSTVNLDMVRKWLDDKQIVPFLPPGYQEFIKSTSESPAETFKPLIQLVQRYWIGDLLGHSITCCDMAFNYFCLKDRTIELQHEGCNSAAKIISTAERFDMEKTANWYRRVAVTLRDKGLFEESLTYFNKSLDLDTTLWLSRGGMATSYFQLGQYEKVIELHESLLSETQQDTSLLQGSPSEMNKYLHAIHERTAECYAKLGDTANALKNYQKGHNVSPQCNKCICQLLLLMDAQDLCDDIISTLKAMQRKMIPTGEYSYLAAFVYINFEVDSDYFKLVARAARQTGEVEFLIDACRDTIRVTRKLLISVESSKLELCLADLYYIYTNEQAKAIRIWNKLIETFAEPRLGSAVFFVKDAATDRLAVHYSRKLWQAGIGSQDAENDVKNLEQLAKQESSPHGTGSSVSFSANKAAIRLGLWYRLQGRKEDADACFRPSINSALELLSNGDDLGNDIFAYKTLREVLLATGEDELVIPIFYCLVAILNGSMETQAGKDRRENGHGTADGKPYIGGCNGCQKLLRGDDIVYVCTYCLGMMLFCESCERVAKDGVMPEGMCGISHVRMIIPPNPDPYMAGKFRVGGTLVDLEGFKKQLARRWRP
ncbi:NACHT and TPR domain-containing protein [Nannizzia gypsea CBS 118893]|uniref:NACHT and TPR domain-containing protein n=1 Tax=Arthroderma gypseum (strain ATCC MYA-4604 / CBS 118893) TaxID=535722 RepID=E4V036_ARTGP|nr:NACHT and TPR domain-containing protein [Nannizzia gypsea CBS 118893]EFR02973.1 NACHT and TPR domain-containing protein [Nannizzia gypsea CBS 118893]